MTRDAQSYRLPVAAVEAIPEPALDESDEIGLRQCGRCRMMFQGDPTLSIHDQSTWSLCPTCNAILLPGRAQRANVVALRPRQASDES